MSQLLAINSSSNCCDGYFCCSQCCSTCSSCSKKKCTYYQCNCKCCTGVSDRLCTVTCRECWTPKVTLKYETQTNVMVFYNMTKECQSDYHCVDEYLTQWAVNNSKTCYYNPDNVMELALTNEYTPYKFGIMYLFAALTVLSTICGCSVLLKIVMDCGYEMGYWDKSNLFRNNSKPKDKPTSSTVYPTSTLETIKPLENSKNIEKEVVEKIFEKVETYKVQPIHEVDLKKKSDLIVDDFNVPPNDEHVENMTTTNEFNDEHQIHVSPIQNYENSSDIYISKGPPTHLLSE